MMYQMTQNLVPVVGLGNLLADKRGTVISRIESRHESFSKPQRKPGARLGCPRHDQNVDMFETKQLVLHKNGTV